MTATPADPSPFSCPPSSKQHDVLSHSVMSDSAADPVDCGPQALLSIGILRQAYWVGLPCPPAGSLAPGTGAVSLSSSALAAGFLYH